MQILTHESSDQYLADIQQASRLIKRWLDKNNLYLGGGCDQLKDTLNLNITPQGRDKQAIFKDIEKQLLPNCVATSHTHCLAHLHPPTLIIGQVAELIISATNQSMDSWNQSPAATYIEQKLIDWLCQLCGFKDKTGFEKNTEAGGVFTSGGTQSNLMGLLLARNHFYQQQDIDIQRDGLTGLAPSFILCSDQAHFSIAKNASLLGLGSNVVKTITTNDKGVMDIEELKSQVERYGADNIMAIVATAGTTDAGAIDPLPTIAEVCQQHNIWLHVDAAWGGALLLSQRYQDWVAGINQADSITLDFHKHFFLPISCGAFLLKDKHHFSSIRQHSDYLNPSDDDQDNIPNLVTYSLQTTRRFDALKLWLALDLLGTNGYGELIDKCIDTAQQAADMIDIHPDFILVQKPIISSVLFYYFPQQIELSGINPSNQQSIKGLDTKLSKNKLTILNKKIAQQLLINNQANIATTEYKQQFCLKFTILNPETQLSDIKNILDDIRVMGKAIINKNNLKNNQG